MKIKKINEIKQTFKNEMTQKYSGLIDIKFPLSMKEVLRDLVGNTYKNPKLISQL